MAETSAAHAQLLARALRARDPGAVAALAAVAERRTLDAGAELEAGHAWLVLDGAVEVEGRARPAGPGELVGWAATFADGLAPVVARARGEASVLELAAGAVRDAVAADFDLALELARPFALAAPRSREAEPGAGGGGLLERARQLRGIAPFDAVALDAVLEIVALDACGSGARTTLLGALAGAGEIDHHGEAVLDALEDHPLSMLAVLAWLAGQAFGRGGLMADERAGRE